MLHSALTTGAVIWLVGCCRSVLGISMLFSLPLTAVAHNGVAALLLLTLVMLNFRLTKALQRLTHRIYFCGGLNLEFNYGHAYTINGSFVSQQFCNSPRVWYR